MPVSWLRVAHASLLSVGSSVCRCLWFVKRWACATDAVGGKKFPYIHLQIHNSFNFWAVAMKCTDFINLSFLHVLTKKTKKNQQTCWWNSNLEKLPQSPHCESFTALNSQVNFRPWCTPRKFHCVKVIGEFSPTMWCKTSSLQLWVNFYPWCMGRKFYNNVWQRLKSKSCRLQWAFVCSLTFSVGFFLMGLYMSSDLLSGEFLSYTWQSRQPLIVCVCVCVCS